MTATLACCWALTPWRLEAARSGAAWLEAVGAGPVDAVRADLDGLVSREQPRAPLDGRLRHTVSLSGSLPRTWPEISAYAESAVRATRTWARSGVRWESGYSGTCGLADHLALALLRGNGTVPSWTAHLIDLPTHDPSGARLEAPVESGALLHTCARLLHAWEVPEPAGDQAADWVLALIAGGADRIVVGSAELADGLAASPGWAGAQGVRSRVEIWRRPAVREWAAGAGAGIAGAGIGAAEAGMAGAAAAGADAAGGAVAITAIIDGPRLPMLEPVLRALVLLGRAEQERIRLTLVTDDAPAVAVALRRHGLEDAVAVTSPGAHGPDLGAAATGPAARRTGLTLVVDAPVPAGLGWSPAPLPELADAEASGGEIILLAPQDSPLTRHAVAHHLPAEHVSAARALLSRLAAGDADVAGFDAGRRVCH